MSPSARPSSFVDNVDYEAADASYIESLGTRTLRLSQVRWAGTQLRAQCLLYEDQTLLFQTDLDLVALSDRERFIRMLGVFEDSADEGAEPWARTIHSFFARTIQHEAQIEQPICISDVPPREDARFIVISGMPLLAADFTMIFGDGGSKKSLMGLWWVAQLSMLGTKVLWIDWEMQAQDHQERLQTLFADEPFPNLYHLMGTAPLSQMEDTLREHIRELGITFVVIDSAMAACPGKNGSPSDMPTDFFQALRRLKVGALIIGHTTKAGEDTKPLGSVGWHNSVRGSWHVSSANDWVVLTNRKDSHGGPVAEGDSLTYRVDRVSPTETVIGVGA